MSNRKFTIKLFLLSLFFIVSTPLFMNAQSASEIEAAKAYARSKGYSEEQINAMVNKQQGASAGKAASTESVGVDRNIAQEQINTNSPISVSGMYTVAGEDMDVQQNRRMGDVNPTFGHSIFKNENLNFIPSYNIPTPDNYKLSSGDEVIIDIWGAVVTNITAKISPEGSINIPDLGPVYIYGQTIVQAEKNLKNYLSKIYSGINDPTPDTFVKLSLGKIKSVTVNVIGDVETPGTYTLPSMSTIASALYLAGGPNELGTVREIKLYRNNKLESTFDVYDYILSGQSGENVMLEDNDVIIVSPNVGLVTIKGSVKRPMIYEIKDGETLADLFEYSGGFSTSAYKGSVQVDRYKYDGDKSGAVAQTFNVEANDFASFNLLEGDVVTVRSNDNRFANKVTVSGAVWHPGSYSLSENMNSLKQLLVKAGGIKEDAYSDRGYIVRLDENREKIQVAFNLNNVILGKENLPLMPDDSVRIYYRNELESDQTIQIVGEVNAPKTVEYRRGMTIGDAILMAGGTNEAATLEKVEIARRILNDKEPVINISDLSDLSDLSDTIAIVLRYNLLKNPQDADVELEPYDMVFVRKSIRYKPQQGIVVEGEVNYPGTYVIEKNVVRLSDVIRRAEGFNKDAYPKGAKLTRVLTDDEFERLQIAMEIAQKQTSDSLALKDLEIGDRYTIAIDLEQALKNPGSYADVVLRDNDILSVPKLNNTVKISGGVLYTNTVSYNPRMGYKYYISNAGGFEKGALKNKIYMVHMNGSVATKGTKDFRVQPGTEIIVPTKTVRNNGQALATLMSVATSTASLAAMIVTIINSTK